MSVISLALVLGMLAGLLWWLRRMAARSSSGRYVQVIETVALGPHQSLHLVRLGNRTLLLASTPQRCELLSEMEGEP